MPGACYLPVRWTELQPGVDDVSDQNRRDNNAKPANRAAAIPVEPVPVPDESDAAGARKGLFGRFNARINDAMATNRGTDTRTDIPTPVPGANPIPAADDVALRRARPARSAKMIIPEGTIVQGSIIANGETEIGGQINGDITVDGRLILSASAVVSGNVRAVVCAVEGAIHGKTECTDSLELGRSGHLHADAMVAKRFALAGQVDGNIMCGGMLNLLENSRVTGNIRTPRLVMEEGAVFNGHCAMRATPRQPLPQQPQQQLAIET